ncbi:MAG: SatD family protein [Candidatus Methanoperedens sp.]|nr:SatD family protein [Candidatus Methanoperedens sp.]
MKHKFYVMLGDVIASRRIKNRGAFQRKLEKTCANVNLNFVDDIYADFNFLKGIDEIGGVLTNINSVYKIMNTFLEQCYPDSIRFVLVFDYIDIAVESHEVSRMDGPAFHKASDMLKDLKGSRLIFKMSIGDEIMDKILAGETNLLFLLKKDWSPRQRMIINEYRKMGNQNMVANALGITQQAVSKALNRSMWKEFSGIEEDLNYVLEYYSPSLPEKIKLDKK